MEFAKETLETARRVLPDYSSPFSPRKFTQPQLLTMLALRQFFKLDYHGHGRASGRMEGTA